MRYGLVNNFFSKIKIIIILFLLSLIIIAFSVYNKIFNIKVCICTCGKQENKYAKEFVNHYYNYGIDKIFIYDNNDNNGENFSDVLSDYIKSGFVEIINYREKRKIQMKVFNHCYQKNKYIYDWFIYYDMDEFIHLHNYKNIKKYLSLKDFNKCNVIYLNHIIHTDNNQIYYYNKSLFERFPEIENFKTMNYSYKPRYVLRDVTKIIIRGNITGVNFTTPHFLDKKIKNTCNGLGKKIFQQTIHLDNPDHKNYYFDHFYFKSSEEYLNKLNVGGVYYGNKRGYNIYWFQIYFAFNKITNEKLDFFENKTGVDLSLFREKIS